MQSKVPERMCVGCRKMFPKSNLYRLTRLPHGCITLDLSGKNSGRGAYICKNESCFNKAIKNKALQRALKTQIPNEILLSLEGIYGSNS